MQAKFRNLSKKWSRRTWWRLFVGRVLLFLVLLTALVTGVLFVDFVYKTFSVRRGELPTEAIVVLAGGKGRIEEGLRLYCAGEVQHLFLIGVDPGVTREKLLRQRGVTNLNEDIVIEQASRNTLENALYARSLLEQRQIHSITLITSRYHMKRAILIFRNVLPDSIAVYPYPVDSSNLKAEWWRHFGSFRLLFTEFYKYCLFRLLFLMEWG